MSTARFAWKHFRTRGWQSAVGSLVMAGILVGAVLRVPRPWGAPTWVVFALTGLGAVAFALGPWAFGVILAQAVRTGVLVEAEVVASSSGGRELLVPFQHGAFRSSFNPKRSWQRLVPGAHVLVFVEQARPRLLVDFGPVETESGSSG